MQSNAYTLYTFYPLLCLCPPCPRFTSIVCVFNLSSTLDLRPIIGFSFVPLQYRSLSLSLRATKLVWFTLFSGNAWAVLRFAAF